MDYLERKKKLVEEFNRNQQSIQQLTQRNQQLLGQLQIIEELEQENKNKDKKIIK